ncbi:RRP15-like protein [Varroa destructor]|uniref:RRP15-like protein n=1 Tax=Varroa destructor TaxID=109461 RepID=A0A7M7J7L7_VARDE|nr:RRP15-like protein [Varroa destructor]
MAIVGQEVNSPDTGITLRTGNDSEDDQVEQNKSLLKCNPSWASVFAKVLTQNPKIKKTKKTLVLAKAKKDADLKQQRKHKAQKLNAKAASKDSHHSRRKSFKIVDKEGNLVDVEELPSLNEQEKTDDEFSTDDEDCPVSRKKSALERQRLRRQRMQMDLLVPQPGDPYEKVLLRTATKGVVQLFNAVNEFQEEKRKQRDNESSDEDERRYKKGRFMETLNKIQEKKQKNGSVKLTSKWEALRDDFMTNSKMRDWDKQDSEANSGDDED